MATATIDELAKQTKIPGLGKLAKDAFDMITETASEQDEKNQARHDELLASLKRIQEGIKGISDKITTLQRSLDTEFPTLKTDSAGKNVESITSLYEQYASAMKAFVNQTKETLPGNNRATLTKHGSTVSTTTYADLKQLHALLVKGGSECLIAKACKVVREKTKDIVTFSTYMSIFMMHYSAVQAQGIYMMTVAAQDPTVPFSDAADDIQKIWENLSEQQRVLVQHFGPRTYVLAKKLIAQSKTDKLRVSLTFGWGGGARMDYVGDVSTGHILNTKGSWSEWDVRSKQDLATVSADGDYSFELIYAEHGKEMGYVLSGFHQKDCLGEQSGASWTIVPTADDQVRLQYRSNKGDSTADKPYKACEGYYATIDSLTSTKDSAAVFNMMTIEDFGLGSKMRSGPAWDSTDDQSDRLHPGKSLRSPNSLYKLEIMADTGVILFNNQGDNGKVVFKVDAPKTNTGDLNDYHAMSGGYLLMTGKGNLIAYNKDNQPYWDTWHWSAPGNYLELTDKGQMLIKDKDGIERVHMPYT